MILYPVSMFHIYGTMCCIKMHKTFNAYPFSKKIFCFDANTISEANCLCLWGNLSPQLIALIKMQMPSMLSRRAVIHIAGCDHREPIAGIAIDRLFTSCALSNVDITEIIKEARSCLAG